MPPLPSRTRARVPYWVRFSATVASLTAFTSVFVLVVLPQRFVLQAGLVESGITFPVGLLPFFSPGLPPVVAPRPPVPPPPVRPGPAEAFWDAVLPLLRAGNLERAVPLFEAYLRAHPRDAGVWREFAVVLTRLERYDEAERIYVQLRRSAADPGLTLELARLLRDRGDLARALPLYRELLALQPDEAGLREEYARALTTAGDYAAAAAEYRRLVARDPSRPGLRLELARVLYWGGRRPEALAELAAVPDLAEAAALREAIVRELPVAAAPVDTLLEDARRAVIAGDFAGAARHYSALLARDPDSADLWREWADVLQYQLQDFAGARDALHRLAALRPLSRDERLRLAQLHAWTADEAGARAMLLALIEEDPASAEGWALLGDLYRFGGDRQAADAAYRSALALEPQHGRAVEGRRAIARQTSELILDRERPSAGPEVLYFGDSDAFRRWDLGARASFQWGAAFLTTRAGYRALEGIALDGTSGSERGPYAEVELARWWRLGTVRASVAAGFEQIGALGTEPTAAVRVALPDAGGASLEAAWEHGPAFHRTATLESVLGALRADNVEASASRGLGTGWSLAGSGAATSLRGDESANWRFSGFATLRRQLSAPVAVALTSQILAFADSAPVVDGRRLYWDPELFAAVGLQVEGRVRTAGGLDAFGRVTGGGGLVRERAADAADLVPQFSGEAGLRYDTRRLTASGSLAYLRGREGAYNAFGAQASLGVRY